MDGYKTEQKFYAHLHLVHGRETKVARAQIDSASTCNTMLRKLFPDVKISKTKTTISTSDLPTIEEKLALLTKAKVFTTVDVSKAFQTFLPFRNLTSRTQYLYGLTRMKTRSIQQRNSLHQRLLCEITMTRLIHVQIEKECPAIVTCMSKWHQYLYGKGNITVHTDHQPLETIFNKPLSKTPRRLQKMILNLQQYQFKVTYKKEKSSTLQTLGRARP